MISVFAIGCFIGIAVVVTAVPNHILICDLAVIIPPGLQLSDPVLVRGQTGDGLTHGAVLIRAPQGDHQVLGRAAFIDLNIFPVTPALLLHHKAGLPGIIARGIGTGVPLVIVVHPDLFDGDTLEVQNVGGNVAVTLECNVGQDASAVDVLCVRIGAVNINRYLNCSSCRISISDLYLSFHYPVLQESENAGIRRGITIGI